MQANRLIREKSPYLLQHAHNPVDWRPWGPEAFEAAREAGKPVFLSVGYSTCHWCHVMERESFEDPAIAALLNEHFVPVKVDREERPDVDRLYMTYVQAATGSGGWPMSVWLTPDLKPFLGGTYFPPEDRYGRPGFRRVLERVASLWQSNRAAVIEAGEGALAELRRIMEAEPAGAAPDAGSAGAAFQVFRRTFDTRQGGFGGAPKFPRPSVHNFLLRYHYRTGNREALEMVLATLDALARGGIRDHLGGGFHRYAVDGRWFLPHFEKMLYDQAQLAVSFLEAYQITGRAAYAVVAREVLDYVLRDMTDPEGGFYSAEDADSAADSSRPEARSEGAFYLWRRAEIEALLGRPAADWFCLYYGVEESGNVRDDPHGEFAGKNVLYEAMPLDGAASGAGVPAADFAASLAGSRAVLLAARERRSRPRRDGKILTAWNGLMISALALGARSLEEPRYLEAARRARTRLLDRLYDAGAGTLLRRYCGGEAAIPGYLEDYAFLVRGLLDLYEAGLEWGDLELAARLSEKQLKLFEDAANGGFFSSQDGGPFGLRAKDDYDGAEPAGNSVAALNLFRLAAITGRSDFRQAAERTLAAFSSRLNAAPETLPQMLVALERASAKETQVVIAGEPGAPDTVALARAASRGFHPSRTVLLAAGPAARKALEGWQPAVRHMGAAGGKAAAYVCENFTCQAPVTDVEELENVLR